MKNFATRRSSIIFELVVLSVLVILPNISWAADFNQYDVEWDAAISGTLYRGDILANGEYIVKATQFSSPVPGIKNMQGNIVPDGVVHPMVYLSIFKNDVLVREIVMDTASDPYIDPDYEIKVMTTEFLKRNSRDWVYEYYNPWAIVSVQTRAKPKLEIDIITDKTIYTSHRDSAISAKIKIINSGQAFIKNVDVNFSVDLDKLKLRGGDIRQLHQHYDRMDKNSVQSFMVIFIVPELIDEMSYSMSADVKGYDMKSIEYNETKYSSIIVTPEQSYLMINKALRDRIYLDDNETVKITVANGGMYDAYNISVTDSMSKNFELVSYVPLQWNIPVLKSGEEWHTTYFIKPLRASLSGFSIPEATAKFIVNNRPYDLSSKRTTVIVNGPIIVVDKTVSKNVVNISDDVKVTVTVNNVGSMPTRAEIKDSEPLPDGVSFVSGDTSIAPTFLELNIPQRFSYIIRGNSDGEVQLPPVTVRYIAVEYRGTKWLEINSTGPTIIFTDPEKISSDGTNNNIIDDTDSSNGLLPVSKTYNLYIAVAAIILVGVFVWRKLY